MTYYEVFSESRIKRFTRIHPIKFPKIPINFSKRSIPLLLIRWDENYKLIFSLCHSQLLKMNLTVCYKVGVVNWQLSMFIFFSRLSWTQWIAYQHILLGSSFNKILTTHRVICHYSIFILIWSYITPSESKNTSCKILYNILALYNFNYLFITLAIIPLIP